MSTGLSGAWATAKDWLIAAGVAATLLVSAFAGDNHATDFGVLGYALVGASGLSLIVGRQAPVLVLVFTGLCAVAYQAIGFEVPAVAYLFAVYGAVRSGQWIITLIVSVCLLITLPFAVMVSPTDMSVGDAFVQARDILELAWLIAAAAAGEALRQAEQRADEAERTREETARLRAIEERLHIARELHDSLTHQISIIKVQAEVAVHLAHKRGEQVPEALLAIREAGREATRELRATLETLRDDDKSPAHGLVRVPELMKRARATGLDARLTVEGFERDLPISVDQSAYRIIQEALTNIARHAAATTAAVRIDYRPGVLAIRVDDNGKAMVGDSLVPGVGLLGMRERITILGGRLRAEPRSEGGFTVQVELPLDAKP